MDAIITTYDLETAPDVNGYIAGLKAIRNKMKPEHFRILEAQYFAPRLTANAKDLAVSASITGGHPVVNKLYGGLGRMFCEETGFVPEVRPKAKHKWWAVWSIGYDTRRKGFLWEMRAQVAEAIQKLGWVHDISMLDYAFRKEQEERTAQSLSSPRGDRLANLASAPTHPGIIHLVRTEFRRNPDVVAEIIHAAKGRCDLCGAQAPFRKDVDGTPYLEVHHITPLSRGGEDAIRNAVALCPNCHREMHHGQDQERHSKHLRHIAEERAAVLFPHPSD